MAGASLTDLAKHQGVRQFVKFCIVGFGSMLIDVGGLNLLTHTGLHWAVAQVISFSLAVTNGFYWNSRWTFRGQGDAAKHELYLRFLAVNIVGLLLNMMVMKLVFAMWPGKTPTHIAAGSLILNVSKGCAIVVVSLWNFFANKHWTFRSSSAPMAEGDGQAGPSGE